MDLSAYHRLSTTELVAQCAEQNRLFYQRQGNDQQFCLELFRRAIVKREDLAWTALVTQYRPQVERWIVREGSISVQILEELVADAIMRFWRAYTPNDFLRARGLSDVLGYWRDCAHSAVVDWQRRQRRETFLLDDLDDIPSPNGESDRWADTLAQQELRAELWRLILAHCQDEDDVLLIHRVFMEGHKPRHVFAQNPHRFVRQEVVYQRLRNLKDRLRRDSQFEALLQDYLR